MKSILKLFSVILLLGIIAQIASASTFEANYTNNQNPTNAQFIVKTLKYEPFPVNARDWFDLWVKAENIGQSDAKDASFTLLTEYPFEVNDSIREFGIVPGTLTANKNKQPGDINIQANQIIMKFRVKVEDNAPEGENVIKIQASTDKNTVSSIVYSLPIEIEKTKTKFVITLQSIDSQGMSFVITNEGDNPAKSASLAIDDEGIISLVGNQPSSLGDLSQGDVIIAHQSAVPKPGITNITVKILYTDTAGIRSSFEKVVQIDNSNVANLCIQQSDKAYLRWVYGLVGLLLGAFIILIIFLIRQKNKSH
jgi:hypothetical protein